MNVNVTKNSHPLVVSCAGRRIGSRGVKLNSFPFLTFIVGGHNRDVTCSGWIRNDEILISAATRYTDGGSQIERNFNYAPLVNELRPMQGQPIATTIEAFADQLYGIVTESGKGLKRMNIDIKLACRSLFFGNEEGAQIVFGRSSMATSARSVELKQFPLNVVIDHNHWDDKDRVECVPVRREKVLVSVGVSYANGGSGIRDNWNFKPLVEQLRARNGIVLRDPIETVADDVMATTIRSINGGMYDRLNRVDVLIERPQLFVDGEFGAQTEITRWVNFHSMRPKGEPAVCPGISVNV